MDVRDPKSEAELRRGVLQLVALALLVATVAVHWRAGPALLHYQFRALYAVREATCTAKKVKYYWHVLLPKETPVETIVS